MLKGKFTIGKITRIDRQDDVNTISNKWADYSYKTINQLINERYKQASAQLKKDKKRKRDNKNDECNKINLFFFGA
ncbi:MAG TPA: hypothetical protein VFC05_13680 [Nitrososphaeraceae archaeon]|nr:hypothetical protein [Nitrososphaeraceae archaeon]